VRTLTPNRCAASVMLSVSARVLALVSLSFMREYSQPSRAVVASARAGKS
jgi:hypothetical protein